MRGQYSECWDRRWRRTGVPSSEAAARSEGSMDVNARAIQRVIVRLHCDHVKATHKSFRPSRCWRISECLRSSPAGGWGGPPTKNNQCRARLFHFDIRTYLRKGDFVVVFKFLLEIDILGRMRDNEEENNSETIFFQDQSVLSDIGRSIFNDYTFLFSQ